MLSSQWPSGLPSVLGETSAESNLFLPFFSEPYNHPSIEVSLQNQDPLNFCETIPSENDDAWLHAMHLLSQNQSCSEADLIKILFNKFLESFTRTSTDTEQIVNRIYNYLETNKKNSLSAAIALTFHVCQYLERENGKLNQVSQRQTRIIVDLPSKMRLIWEGILKKYLQDTSKASAGFPLEMAALLAQGKTSFSQMETILQIAGLTCLPAQNQKTLGQMPVSLCSIIDTRGNPKQGIKITFFDGEERHILVLPLDIPEALKRCQKEIVSKDQAHRSDYFQSLGAICSLFLHSNDSAKAGSVVPVSADWMREQTQGVLELAVCCLSHPTSEPAFVGYLLLTVENIFNQGFGDIPKTNTAILNFARAFAQAPTSAIGFMLDSFKILLSKGSLNLSKTFIDREFAALADADADKVSREFSALKSLAKVLAMHHEDYANRLAIQLWIENAKRWELIKRDEMLSLGLDILEHLPKSRFSISFNMICSLRDSKMLSLPVLCDYLETCKKWRNFHSKSAHRTQSNLASLQKITCQVLETEIQADKKVPKSEAAKASVPIFWLIKALFMHDQQALAIELLRAALPLLVRADKSQLARLILDHKDLLNSDGKATQWQTLAGQLADSYPSANEKNANDHASRTIQAMQLLAAFEIYDADLWKKVLAMASHCKNPIKLQVLEEFLKVGDKLSTKDTLKEAALCWKDALSLLHSVRQLRESNAMWLSLLEIPKTFTQFMDAEENGISEICSAAYRTVVDACIPMVKQLLDKQPAKTSTLAATLVSLNKKSVKDPAQDIALLNLLLDIYFAYRSSTETLDRILELSAEIENSNDRLGSNITGPLKKLFKLIATLEKQADFTEKRQRLLEISVSMAAKLDDPALNHTDYLNTAALVKPYAKAKTFPPAEVQIPASTDAGTTPLPPVPETIGAASSEKAIDFSFKTLETCGQLLFKAVTAWRREAKKQKTLDLTKEWHEIITAVLKLKISPALKKVENWLGNDMVSEQFDEEQLNELYRNLVSETLLSLETLDPSGLDRKTILSVLEMIQKNFTHLYDNFDYCRDLIKRIVALAIKITPKDDEKGPLVEEIFLQCEILLNMKLHHDMSTAKLRPVISNLLDLEYIDWLFKELKTENLHSEQYYRSAARRLNAVCSRKLLPGLLSNPSETLRKVISLVDHFIFNASPVRWQRSASEMTSGEDLQFHEEQAPALMKTCCNNGFYIHNAQEYCIHHQYLLNTWPRILLVSDAVYINLFQKLLDRLIKLENARFIERAFSLFVNCQALFPYGPKDDSLQEYDKLLTVCSANPVRLIGQKTIIELAFQSILDAEAAHFSTKNHSRSLLMVKFIDAIGNIISSEQGRPEPDFALQVEWAQRACQYLVRALDENLYSNHVPRRTYGLYLNIVHLLEHIKISQRVSQFPETNNSLINLLEKASKLEINEEIILRQVLLVFSRIAENIPLPTNPASRQLFGRFLSLFTAFHEYDEFQDILENQLPMIFRKIYSRCIGNEELGTTVETMLISSGLLTVDSDYDDDDENDIDENEVLVDLDDKNRASGNDGDYTSGSDGETDS